MWHSARSGGTRRNGLERRTMLILLFLTALQAAPAPATDPALYIVGPNDVLNITVFNQPQMSGKFAVESDGTLAFPLVGRIAVGGLSIRAVEDEVRRRLSAGYLTDPRVSVTVEQYRSQQIFVMGEVKQPGSLQFTGAMTLIEALARVGSTTDRAGSEAMIVRPSSSPAAVATTQKPNGSNSETIRVNLQNLQAGALSENVALRAGDTIFVPRAATVFVSGQVKAAGEYVIRTGMTVRQALALAGGVTDRGSTRRLQIIRQVDGKEVTLDVNLQTAVQQGDTIVVRERFM
jgi:polysaccharide biosynthesis/export protein